MYTGLKHLHYLLVALFLLTTLIKTILLFVNQDRFDVYRQKTKVPEMIITMLFLVTGIIMIGVRGAGFHGDFWIKIGMILIAIPLAIVGFKKKNKILALLGSFLFIITFGVAERAAKKHKVEHIDLATANAPQEMYLANCATCHGETGQSMIGGASDLSASTLDSLGISNVITGGIGKMRPFEGLSEEEVAAISSYVISLKKN